MSGTKENQKNQKPAQNAEARTGIEKENREKLKLECYNIFNKSFRQGLIKVTPCRICGTHKKLEAHHCDYNDPLNVVWYCKKHHMQIHVKKRGRKNSRPILEKRKEEVKKYLALGISQKKIAELLNVPYSALHLFTRHI